MARVQPITFRVDVAAGRTVMDSDDHVVWRPGGMDGWILNLTEAGLGRIGHDGLEARPGRLICFKPLAVHDYARHRDAGQWIHLWVYFFPRPTWYDLLVWEEVEPGILVLDLPGAERTAVEAIFQDLVAVQRSPYARRDVLVHNLLEQILLRCDRCAATTAPGIDERIRRVVEACHEDLARPWRVADLAKLAGLSASRFAHRFQEVMGSSPVAFLEGLRMRAAAELLRCSGRRISAIAAEVGIADPAWFAQRFRRWCGRTPRAFRQASR